MITEQQRIRILSRIGSVIKLRAMQLAPIDLGLLRASIKFEIVGDEVIIYCDAPYANDMEYGTPPSPLTDAEKKELEGWADRHGLPAYPIIKKIEREGIKVGTPESPLKSPNGTYRPFLRPALYQSMPYIKKIISEELGK